MEIMVEANCILSSTEVQLTFDLEKYEIPVGTSRRNKSITRRKKEGKEEVETQNRYF
jgi:hypothetical protein